MKETFTRKEIVEVRDFFEDSAKRMDERRQELENPRALDSWDPTSPEAQEARSVFLAQGAFLICAEKLNYLLGVSSDPTSRADESSS